MEVRNNNFTSFIDLFTPNTYIMVILSDQSIPAAVVTHNIVTAKKHFEQNMML